MKSGWAAAVLLAGSSAAPRVVDRDRIQLADPRFPESFQPFHAGLDRPAREAAKAVGRLVEVVERFTGRSMEELLRRYQEHGDRIRGIGIVVGSVVDPATIRNDHIRAHAEEGRLFRVVLQRAAEKSGLTARVTVQKRLFPEAAKALGRPEARLKDDLTGLGRGLGGPWRAEHKEAALAAWMVLAALPRRRAE